MRKWRCWLRFRTVAISTTGIDTIDTISSIACIAGTILTVCTICTVHMTWCNNVFSCSNSFIGRLMNSRISIRIRRSSVTHTIG